MKWQEHAPALRNRIKAAAANAPAALIVSHSNEITAQQQEVFFPANKEDNLVLLKYP